MLPLLPVTPPDDPRLILSVLAMSIVSRQITAGVAGHVDHGKTSLVRALTGMETDRLREEKERGLSIVPGYAYLESERGMVDLIDVPGHEDFIRMMISGATGIDYLLLTVAANEGIKPQTREHLHIADLLGAEKGLAVITKSDLATPGACGRVADEIRHFSAGTFMEGCRIIETSVNDGQSIDNLRMCLEQQLLDPVERNDTGQCYLPLDRVFTMAGFGTVATGTLRNGALATGREVEILPQGRSAVIRQMQVHNREEDIAYPGQRVAVNLRNVDKNHIARGDVLASPGYLKPTRLLDVELRLLEGTDAPPKYGETTRVLFGACEVAAKLRILGGAQTQPGSTFPAQLDCARAVAAPVGERFIVRSMSPARTIGGGRILDNAPAKHRRSDQRAVSRLSRLAGGDTADIIRELVTAEGVQGMDIAALAMSLNLAEEELAHRLDEAEYVFIETRRVMSGDAFKTLCEQALAEVEEFHRTNPLRKGQPLEDLLTRLGGGTDETVFRFLLAHLGAQGLIHTDKTLVRLRDFDPIKALDNDEKKTAGEIADAFKSGALQPPELNEVLQGNPERKRLYRFLTETGELVPLHNRETNRTLVFHRHNIDQAVRKLEQTYPNSVAFTMADARKLLDTSRKYAIPLLEYLDGQRVTVRIGDKRKLL